MDGEKEEVAFCDPNAMNLVAEVSCKVRIITPLCEVILISCFDNGE